MGFLQSFLDVSFRSFVTPRIASIIYGLNLLVVGLLIAGGIATGIAIGTVASVVVAVVMAPLIGFLLLTWNRVLLEVCLAIVQIAHNTRRSIL